MKKAIIILSFVLPLSFLGQNKDIDSLKNVLKTAKEDSNKVYTLNRLGGLIAKSGNLDNALPYFENALNTSEKIKFHKGAAYSLNNIGKVYLNKSILHKALENFFKSLKVSEDNGIKEGMAYAFGNIAIVYDQQKKPDKALEYHLKSLKIDEELGNKKGIATSYNSIGNIYYEKGEYEKVIEYYNKSLEIKEEIGDREGVASTLANIGNIYYFRNVFKKTLEYYLRALEILEEVNDKQGLVMLTNNIAQVYRSQKEYKNGLDFAGRSLKMSLELGSLDDTQSAYKTLSEIYEAMGDNANAYKNFKQYIVFKDSIYNKENTRKEVEAEMKYDFEKKENITRLENEKAVAIHKEEAEKQRLIIYFGGGLLILVLFFAFYAYRNNIQKQKVNQTLSQQKEEILAQRNQIEKQKAIVDEKNKNVTDSINYAKRIQEAILPPEHLVTEHLLNSFVLYMPKDIVAGDFYWMEVKKDVVFIAVADCTGHGVPGAMVSVVCSNALNRAVLEFGIEDPGKILDKTRDLVVETFAKGDEEVKDGMDISLCSINKRTHEVKWAGANNSLWYFEKNELKKIVPNKQPIGKTYNPTPFATHTLKLSKGDSLYLFTDGYADQFGGPRAEKFKKIRMSELITEIQILSADEQKNKLIDAFENWKGKREQIDDVCIIGIKL